MAKSDSVQKRLEKVANKNTDGPDVTENQDVEGSVGDSAGTSAGRKRKADTTKDVYLDAGEDAESIAVAAGSPSSTREKRQKFTSVLVPMTLLVDCGFDELMTDKVPPTTPSTHPTKPANPSLGNHLSLLATYSLLCRQQSLDSPGQPPHHVPQQTTPVPHGDGA